MSSAVSGFTDSLSDISAGSGSSATCKRRTSETGHGASPKPITDPTMRSKLQDARIPGTKVTPRVCTIWRIVF